MSGRATRSARPGPAVWAAALLFIVVIIFRIRSDPPPLPAPPPETSPPAVTARGEPPSTPPDRPPVFTTERGAWSHDPLVADLNLADGTITGDLTVIAAVLDAWVTNFPHTGNPVGDNREITAALSGRNPLRLALVPPEHPAINAAGELCDRYGTPLFFHQISGQQMEIRSAGADRRLYSSDDVLWSPSGVPAEDRATTAPAP